MTEKHTLQSIILKLQEFWAEHGCIIWQPYYTQVGPASLRCVLQTLRERS